MAAMGCAASIWSCLGGWALAVMPQTNSGEASAIDLNAVRIMMTFPRALIGGETAEPSRRDSAL
jgi:hypothetical protein